MFHDSKLMQLLYCMGDASSRSSLATKSGLAFQVSLHDRVTSLHTRKLVKPFLQLRILHGIQRKGFTMLSYSTTATLYDAIEHLWLCRAALDSVIDSLEKYELLLKEEAMSFHDTKKPTEPKPSWPARCAHGAPPGPSAEVVAKVSSA